MSRSSPTIIWNASERGRNRNAQQTIMKMEIIAFPCRSKALISAVIHSQVKGALFSCVFEAVRNFELGCTFLQRKDAVVVPSGGQPFYLAEISEILQVVQCGAMLAGAVQPKKYVFRTPWWS